MAKVVEARVHVDKLAYARSESRNFLFNAPLRFSCCVEHFEGSQHLSAVKSTATADPFVVSLNLHG